jgi:AcrR family transcriptional regulator
MSSVKAPTSLPLHAPRPRGRPKAEDLHELEARLISVALQTFIEHGYGATSMAAVARAARVSKNTLYARFPSKAALFRAILTDQIQRTGIAVERDLRRAGRSLEGSLQAFGEQTLRASLVPEIRHLNRLIASEAVRFPELGAAAEARMQMGVQQVAAHLRDAAEREGWPCRDPDAAAEIYVLMLRGWYSQVVLNSRPVGRAEIRRIVERAVRAFMCSRGEW